MRNQLNIVALSLVAISVFVPLQVLAHHGNASYDNTKKVTVKGVVTDWVWANPHCFLKSDAHDEKGQLKHWLMEASNPPDMTRQGWAKSSFKPGDQIIVTVIVTKNGEPIGRFVGKDNILLNGKPFPPKSQSSPVTSNP